MSKPTRMEIFEAIAQALREFGYSDTTAAMVEETYAAMVTDADLPHGIVGMFAKDQIERIGMDKIKALKP